ncbi:MAG: acyl-CoA thioesterase [Christensenellales bacterium]|jgi:acyl-CoA hydrolase
MKIKTIADSRAEHTQIVFSEHINGTGRLFGGRLVEWMDIVAAVVARRHSECEVTTVSIESLNFAAPARLNDTLVIIGEMVSVGNTSMKVRVTVYVEKLSGERQLINTAYFILVALDKEDKPCRVCRLRE